MEKTLRSPPYINKDTDMSIEPKLVKNGPNFIDLSIKLIEEAKFYIFLHTYIFTYDDITKPVIDSLINASKKGVKVYLIFDGFGSLGFPESIIKKLRTQGAQFSYFKPLFKVQNFGRRLHEKVMLIDTDKVLVGGINYSQEFNHPLKGIPWLDYAVLIEGVESYKVYNKIYPLYKKHFKLNRISHSPLVSKENQIKVLHNDWAKHKQEIYKSFIRQIKQSHNEIIILATYFIPGKKLLKELRKASKRGVKIKLIFGKFSDHRLVTLSSQYLYEWYLKQNIEIYEWDKSIVHGKIALFDSQISSIGSYNHNYISRYGNVELNLEIYNQTFNQDVKKELDYILQSSILIDKTRIPNSLMHKLILKLIFSLTNIIAFLSVIILYRQNHSKS